MLSGANIFINNLELLQAINNWQISSTEKRGNLLKELCRDLPEKYTQCHCRCYRQVILDSPSTLALIGYNELSEKISSWSTSVLVAKEFKEEFPSLQMENCLI